MTFDAQVAWPATTGWGSRRRAWSPATATSHATSARRASASNLVSAGPLKTLAAKAIPGFEEFEDEWERRAPLGWDHADLEPTARRGRAAQRLLPRDHRRDRARRRRLPRHGGVSARGPGSVRAVTSALVELRVLEGPNLYFPRAAIKLTLDLTQLIDAQEWVACVSPPGSACARPARAAGQRFRQRFAGRAIDRLVRQIAAEAGTTRLALRVRPTNDVHQVVVAYPWRNRTRAQALGRAVAEVLDSLLSPDLEELVSHAAESVRASEPGPGPTTLRPRVPIVAVTGTNGKTTTSRMVAHIARTHGLHVGWSSTDGIYVDGELVEAGDYSGPSGRGPGAGPQAGAARGHRDGPRRHPAQGHRAHPQRRLGVHQRLRGPPRAARHRHARPARGGQGRRAPDHQGRRAGRC